MKILTCGNSEGSGFRNAWTGIKNVKGARPLNKFWNFIGAIQMISCRVRLVTWTKPGYITMTRRQSNNVLSGGVASYPTPPPKIPNDNIHWKISRLDSFGIKTTSSSLIIFQRTKLSTRSITHLYWCNWRTFWRKKPPEGHKAGLVLARQCPVSPSTCNPEETGLPGSPTLFSGPNHVGLPPVPWTEKNNRKFAFFVRPRSHCCRGDLVWR